MLWLVLVLAVDPPTCDTGLVCAPGFKSSAQLDYGAGTPDFQCGNRDLLEDGGWGSASKYCLIETHQTESHDSTHADLIVASKYARSAGLLLGVQNQSLLMFYVDYAGNIGSYGSFFTTGNGGGIRNTTSYVGIYGVGSVNTPDVVVGGYVAHANGRYGFGVWGGWNWLFRVRDDGALAIGDQVFRVSTNADAIYFTQELPDGGERTALLGWQ